MQCTGKRRVLSYKGRKEPRHEERGRQNEDGQLMSSVRFPKDLEDTFDEVWFVTSKWWNIVPIEMRPRISVRGFVRPYVRPLTLMKNRRKAPKTA